MAQNGAVTSSYSSARAITASDTVFNYFTAIMATGAGNLVVEGLDGTAVTFTALPIYTIIPLAGQRVKSTGTTSTGIIGFN